MDNFKLAECYANKESPRKGSRWVLQGLFTALFLFVLLLPFIYAVPVLAANTTDARYGGFISIINDNTSAVYNQAVNFTLSTKMLTDDDFAWENLSNLAIVTMAGGDVVYMPAPGSTTNWIVWSVSAQPSSSYNIKLQSGGAVNMGGKVAWFPEGVYWANYSDAIRNGYRYIYPANYTVIGNWTTPEYAWDVSFNESANDPRLTYTRKGSPFNNTDGFYWNLSGKVDINGFVASGVGGASNAPWNLTVQLYNGTWNEVRNFTDTGVPRYSTAYNNTFLFAPVYNVTQARFFPSVNTGTVEVRDLYLLSAKPMYSSWEFSLRAFFDMGRATYNNTADQWIAYQPGYWGLRVINNTTVQAGLSNITFDKPFLKACTSTVDAAGNWTNDGYAGDNSYIPANSAQVGVLAQSWSPFLELWYDPPVLAADIRSNVDYVANYITSKDIDAYYSGDWHDVFNGTFAAYDQANQTHNLTSVKLVEAVRVRLFNEYTASTTGLVREIAPLGINETITNTVNFTLLPGEHEVRVVYDDPVYYDYLRPIGYNADFANNFTAMYDAVAWNDLWAADEVRIGARTPGNATEHYLTNTTFPDDYTITNVTVFVRHQGFNSPDVHEGIFFNMSGYSRALVGKVDNFTPQSTYFWNTTTVNTNPWTGAQWTKADLDDLRLGFNITATGSNSLYLDAAYIRVTAQKPGAGTPTRTIYVDGVAVNTTTGITSNEMPGGPTDIVNIKTLGPWYYNFGNITPYILSMSQSLDDEQRQYIAYNGLSTGEDRSGHGAYINATFRSLSMDNNLTAVFGDFGPFIPAALTGYSIEGGSPMLTSPPDEPAEMYTEGNTNHIIGASIINGALDAGGIPQSLFWIPWSFMISILLGFVTFGFTNSLLTQAMVSAAILFYFALSGGGVIPLWSPIVFIIEAVAVMIARKQISF